MKKFLLFVLIVGGLFVFANRDTYGPRISETIDIYVPAGTQESIYGVYSVFANAYQRSTAFIDVVRADIKTWSLSSSDILIERAGITNPRDNTFSPILSNSRAFLASDLPPQQKLFGLFLMAVTLITWNRTVTLLLIAYILYKTIRGVLGSIRKKRKKSFFDKIGENIPREED